MYNSLILNNFIKSYPHFIHMGLKFWSPVGSKFLTGNYLKFFVTKKRVGAHEQARTRVYKKIPFFEKRGIVATGATIGHFKNPPSFWPLRSWRTFTTCWPRDFV